jgi:predicted acetyltransferase
MESTQKHMKPYNEKIQPIKHTLKNGEQNIIKLAKPSFEQQQIVRNLLELYAYDLTEYWGFDVGPDGYYGYKDLERYWSDPDCYPYLIWVENKLAGCVLIQKKFCSENKIQVLDMSEFFIMKKFRKNNIGKIIAHEIWKNFKDDWQVRILSGNTRACSFWNDAIAKFLGSPIFPLKTQIDGDIWNIYKFCSSPNKPKNINKASPGAG